MRPTPLGAVLAAGVLLGLALPARAVTTTFTNRATFEAAAAGPLTVEGLEDDPEAILTGSLPHMLLGSGLVVDNPVGAVEVQVSTTSTSLSFYPPTAGDRNLTFGDDADMGDYVASFATAAGMTAFGFDLSGFQPEDVGSGGFGSGGFDVELLASGGSVDAFTVAAASANFNGAFWGFINPAGFDEVRITIRSEDPDGFADFVGFDEIAFNVPEPGTALLLAAGLALLALTPRSP